MDVWIDTLHFIRACGNVRGDHGQPAGTAVPKSKKNGGITMKLQKKNHGNDAIGRALPGAPAISSARLAKKPVDRVKEPTPKAREREVER